MTPFRIAAALVCVAFICDASFAGSPPSAILNEVGIDQKLNQTVPLELSFRNESGTPVQLGNYFGTKPVILVFVYYECPMLCTLTLNGLVRSLRAMTFNAGQDFDVIAVSFDPHESWKLAAQKKLTYMDEYRRPGTESGWHFLTGDTSSIEQLTRAAGFRYKYDPRVEQWAHATGILVLTPEGRISRYFYGVEYSARDLRLSLVEASNRRIGSLTDQVLLYCYQYDPETGKYGITIMAVLRIAGIITVLALGGFIVRMSLQS